MCQRWYFSDNRGNFNGIYLFQFIGFVNIKDIREGCALLVFSIDESGREMIHSGTMSVFESGIFSPCILDRIR